MNTQKFHHNPMNSTSKICEDGTSGRNLAAWCLPSWVYRPPCLTWTGKEERGCSHGHPMLLFPITMEEVRVYGEIYGAAGEVVFRYLLLWDVRIWVTQLFLLHHSSKSAATDVLGHLRAKVVNTKVPTYQHSHYIHIDQNLKNHSLCKYFVWANSNSINIAKIYIFIHY